MPLDPTSQLLVQTVEALSIFEGRFVGLKLVNFNTLTQQKRGCFSLVFRAYDQLDQKQVAVKFYDIDPNLQNDLYRIASFQREHDILQSLLSVERCLQLVSALSTYQLPVPGHPGITIPCRYFAVDWVDNEIDKFFYDFSSFTAQDKLRLFNEIVLAVEALHKHAVFHRDLKPDNLRAMGAALKRIVVAIDLGTAARYESAYISSAYGTSVGAPAYASPEATCGLAGNRKLAVYTDLYALGCLLFELFNPDLFYQANLAANPGFRIRLHVMGQAVKPNDPDSSQVDAWNESLRKMSNGVAAVPINGLGNCVPPGVSLILNEVLSALTNVDYSLRPLNTAWVRRKIWIAIKVLDNQAEVQRRVAKGKELRAQKELKAKEKAERLRARLQGALTC